MGDASQPENSPTTKSYLKYSTVPGFFLQDDPATDPSTFDFTQENFGLIDQPYDFDFSLPSTLTTPTPWQRFAHHLSYLNSHSPPSIRYALLFLARHGQGYHNVAESYYGTKAWDCRYSLLNGNGTITWADAHLTSLGEMQARNVSLYWESQIEDQKMPTPQVWVVSPLTRAMRTAQLTWEPLDLGWKAVVKEMLRECIGIHTCDRRSSRSEIVKNFPPPIFHVEDSLSEDDPLWDPELRESRSAQTARLRSLLDGVFEHEASAKEVQYLSLTSHGGSIEATLRAVGHREFTVNVGGVIPVLVRVERVKGRRPEEAIEPWMPREACEEAYDPSKLRSGTRFAKI